MMSYDNSTLNIGVSIFSILVFRYRVGFRSHFGGNNHANLGE